MPQEGGSAGTPNHWPLLVLRRARDCKEIKNHLIFHIGQQKHYERESHDLLGQGQPLPTKAVLTSDDIQYYAMIIYVPMVTQCKLMGNLHSLAALKHRTPC